MSKDFYIMVRGWMDDDVFSSEPYTEREAFLYLVEKAAWKNRRYRSGNKIIQLKRGQFTGSLRYIAEAWQWNKDRVAAYLKILVNADMIQTETQTGQTVVTICKYSKYQDVHSKLQTAGRQRADSGQTAGRQRADKNNQDNQYNQENNSKKGDAEFSPFNVSDLWNEICHQLNPVKSLSLDRQRKIENMMRDNFQTPEDWRGYFGKFADSSFLRGESGGSFIATFDWALNPRNVVKVFDGNYDDREKEFDPVVFMNKKIEERKNAN